MSDETFISNSLKHVEELRRRLIRVLIPFGIFFVLFVALRIDFIHVFGVTMPFVTVDPYQNIGAQFLQVLEVHVLPSSTQLIIVKPTDAVVADFYVCLFLSLIFTMPVLVYQAAAFIGPALKSSEKALVRVTLLPATFLFISGAVIGVWFIAPVLFRVFFLFDVGLGAQPTSSVLSFISFLLIYVAAFGISFEIPVFMVGLTRIGVVKYEVWRKNWRYAIIGSLIFGMIFSPGVTGFTMVVIAIPMIILYFGGMYFARRTERKNFVDQSESVS
ncbi:MAG: translocase [Thermoplasmatales archaeon B_DKE]|nr:MAG: translocase [Thermoplasmatales archaeon B_DKE]